MTDWGKSKGQDSATAALFAVTDELIVESSQGYCHLMAGETAAEVDHIARIWSRVNSLSDAEARSVLVDAIGLLGGIRGHIATVGVDGEPLFILSALGLAPHELTGA